MSFNRENVIWQSAATGTWGIGFFTAAWEGSEADGYDSEWDVEYDVSSFEWASVGHRTEQAAWQSWGGANPGGHSVVTPATDRAACDAYDAMALRLLQARRRDQHRNPLLRSW